MSMSSQIWDLQIQASHISAMGQHRVLVCVWRALINVHIPHEMYLYSIVIILRQWQPAIFAHKHTSESETAREENLQKVFKNIVYN